MSLLNLMGKVGVSLEDATPAATTTTTTTTTTPAATTAPKPATEDTLVSETVVSPVDAPSSAIPAPAVVETVVDPVVPPAPVAVEPLAPPVDAAVVVEPLPPADAPGVAPVVAVEPVPALPVDPNGVMAEQVQEAVAIVELEAEAGQLQAEQCALRDKAEELLDIQTSLEALDAIVAKTGALGITEQTAKTVQLQMRMINRQLGVAPTQFVSTEKFNTAEVRDRHQVAIVALEDIRGAVKASKTKFLAIIEKIIAIFKKIALNYIDGIQALEKEAKALESELAKVKVEGGGGQIKLQNAGQLMVGGSVEREISAEIQGLAHFTASAYPEAVVKFLDGLVKGVLKFDPDGAGTDEVDAYIDQYRKPLAFLIEQQLDTDDLPGGYKLDVSDGGLNVGLKRDKGAESVSAEIDVQPTIKLRHTVRDIIQVVQQLKEIRPEVDKIGKASDKLVAAVKRAADKKGDGNEAAYEQMSDRVAKVVAQSSPRVGEIIGYLVRYCRMQLAVVRQEMAHNAKASKED